MKFFLFLLAFLTIDTCLAGWPLVDREMESTLADRWKLYQIEKKLDRKNLLQELRNSGLLTALQDGQKRAGVFLDELKALPAIKDSINRCFAPSRCSKKILKESILYLRAKKEIDDTAGLVLLAYVTKNPDQLNWLRNRKFDLPEYVNTLKGAERSRVSRGMPVVPTILTSSTKRTKVKPWGKITPRQELFLKYDLFEIKVLTGILEKAQKRISAHDISIIVDYDGDGSVDETIPVGPSERYRFAQKMLTLEVSRETLSQGFLSGKNVTGPHLLMAASELGYVDEGVLSELIQMPELQNKKSQKGKLYLNALWTIGKAGLMAMPGGIYFVLPVIVVESYFQGKKSKEKKDAPTIF